MISLDFVPPMLTSPPRYFLYTVQHSHCVLWLWLVSLCSAITLDNTLVILSTVAPDAGRYYVQAVNDKNGENKTSQPVTLSVESEYPRTTHTQTVISRLCQDRWQVWMHSDILQNHLWNTSSINIFLYLSIIYKYLCITWGLPISIFYSIPSYFYSTPLHFRGKYWI